MKILFVVAKILWWTRDSGDIGALAVHLVATTADRAQARIVQCVQRWHSNGINRLESIAVSEKLRYN